MQSQEQGSIADGIVSSFASSTNSPEQASAFSPRICGGASEFGGESVMRIKRMGVSMELLRLTLAQDNVIPAVKVVSDGLPADAAICGASLSGGTIWLDIQSETYPEVEQGQEIPTFGPCFETIQRASA